MAQRQLNITYKNIVGNSLGKQMEQAHKMCAFYLDNVKFNENDFGT